MKAWMWCAFAVLFAVPVRAQDGGMDDGQERMVAWVKATAEFVAKERFSEADLKSFLEHYKSFDAIGDDSEDEFEERFYKDGKYRFDLVLEDKDYAKWAADHGVDRAAWLRKTMRIISIVMKRQVSTQFGTYEKMLADQLAQLEAAKGDMGEEAYARMKKELDEGLASVKRMKAAFEALPDPTDEEAKLLEKYKKEIGSLMEDEGCGEDEGFEDDEGCGEEEEEEEEEGCE